MEQAKQTMFDLWAGLAVWTVPVLIILELISGGSIAILLGLLAGDVAAAVQVFHMYRQLDIALDLDPGSAQKHIRKTSLQRYLALAVLIAFSMVEYHYVHPIGVVFGLIGVKFSAYIQPMVHKLRYKILRKEEE